MQGKRLGRCSRVVGMFASPSVGRRRRRRPSPPFASAPTTPHSPTKRTPTFPAIWLRSFKGDERGDPCTPAFFSYQALGMPPQRAGTCIESSQATQIEGKQLHIGLVVSTSMKPSKFWRVLDHRFCFPRICFADACMLQRLGTPGKRTGAGAGSIMVTVDIDGGARVALRWQPILSTVNVGVYSLDVVAVLYDATMSHVLQWLPAHSGFSRTCWIKMSL